MPPSEERNEKTAANIRKEIDAFYGRYAAREGITISDAKMRVSTLDIKEYSRKAKQYVADKDFSKQANEEMRIYNLTMKINRLEMLKSNIGLELCASYSELENYFEDSLTKTARKEFRRQAGILGGTVANMEKHAGEIVNGSFRGAKFSERLWANQAYLKTQLDNLLRTGLIQGRNPRELAKSLRKEIETSVYVSERLMRTEMCRVQIGAQLASYQNMGYDKLVIIPEHDERSCDYCETQDGVIVEVAKAVPGVNVPPFHPNCRCSTAGYVDEAGERMKNETKETGGHHYKPRAGDEKRDEIAAKAYEKYAREDDSEAISKNTGFSRDDILKVRRHIFFNKHNLYDGYERFAPEYSMAVAWKRLREGNHLERDLLLLRHELLESEIEMSYNYDIHIAHAEATKVYDWWGRGVQETDDERGEPNDLLQID